MKLNNFECNLEVIKILNKKKLKNNDLGRILFKTPEVKGTSDIKAATILLKKIISLEDSSYKTAFLNASEYFKWTVREGVKKYDSLQRELWRCMNQLWNIIHSTSEKGKFKFEETEFAPWVLQRLIKLGIVMIPEIKPHLVIDKISLWNEYINKLSLLDLILKTGSIYQKKFFEVKEILNGTQKIIGEHMKKTDDIHKFLKQLLYIKLLEKYSTVEAMRICSNYKRRIIIPPNFIAWAEHNLGWQSFENCNYKKLLKKIDEGDIYKFLYSSKINSSLTTKNHGKEIKKNKFSNEDKIFEDVKGNKLYLEKKWVKTNDISIADKKFLSSGGISNSACGLNVAKKNSNKTPELYGGTCNGFTQKIDNDANKLRSNTGIRNTGEDMRSFSGIKFSEKRNIWVRSPLLQKSKTKLRNSFNTIRKDWYVEKMSLQKDTSNWIIERLPEKKRNKESFTNLGKTNISKLNQPMEQAVFINSSEKQLKKRERVITTDSPHKKHKTPKVIQNVQGQKNVKHQCSSITDNETDCNKRELTLPINVSNNTNTRNPQKEGLPQDVNKSSKIKEKLGKIKAYPISSFNEKSDVNDTEHPYDSKSIKSEHKTKKSKKVSNKYLCENQRDVNMEVEPIENNHTNLEISKKKIIQSNKRKNVNPDEQPVEGRKEAKIMKTNSNGNEQKVQNTSLPSKTNINNEKKESSEPYVKNSKISDRIKDLRKKNSNKKNKKVENSVSSDLSDGGVVSVSKVPDNSSDVPPSEDISECQKREAPYHDESDIFNILESESESDIEIIEESQDPSGITNKSVDNTDVDKVSRSEGKLSPCYKNNLYTNKERESYHQDTLNEAREENANEQKGKTSPSYKPDTESKEPTEEQSENCNTKGILSESWVSKETSESAVSDLHNENASERNDHTSSNLTPPDDNIADQSPCKNDLCVEDNIDDLKIIFDTIQKDTGKSVKDQYLKSRLIKEDTLSPVKNGSQNSGSKITKEKTKVKKISSNECESHPVKLLRPQSPKSDIEVIYDEGEDSNCMENMPTKIEQSKIPKSKFKKKEHFINDSSEICENQSFRAEDDDTEMVCDKQEKSPKFSEEVVGGLGVDSNEVSYGNEDELFNISSLSTSISKKKKANLNATTYIRSDEEDYKLELDHLDSDSSEGLINHISGNVSCSSQCTENGNNSCGEDKDMDSSNSGTNFGNKTNEDELNKKMFSDKNESPNANSHKSHNAKTENVQDKYRQDGNSEDSIAANSSKHVSLIAITATDDKLAEVSMDSTHSEVKGFIKCNTQKNNKDCVENSNINISVVNENDDNSLKMSSEKEHFNSEKDLSSETTNTEGERDDVGEVNVIENNKNASKSNEMIEDISDHINKKEEISVSDSLNDIEGNICDKKNNNVNEPENKYFNSKNRISVESGKKEKISEIQSLVKCKILDKDIEMNSQHEHMPSKEIKVLDISSDSDNEKFDDVKESSSVSCDFSSDVSDKKKLLKSPHRKTLNFNNSSSNLESDHLNDDTESVPRNLNGNKSHFENSSDIDISEPICLELKNTNKNKETELQEKIGKLNNEGNIVNSQHEHTPLKENKVLDISSDSDNEKFDDVKESSSVSCDFPNEVSDKKKLLKSPHRKTLNVDNSSSNLESDRLNDDTESEPSNLNGNKSHFENSSDTDISEPICLEVKNTNKNKENELQEKIGTLNNKGNIVNDIHEEIGTHTPSNNSSETFEKISSMENKENIVNNKQENILAGSSTSECVSPIPAVYLSPKRRSLGKKRSSLEESVINKSLTPLKVSSAALSSEIIISPDISDEENVPKVHDVQTGDDNDIVSYITDDHVLRSNEEEQALDSEFKNSDDIASTSEKLERVKNISNQKVRSPSPSKLSSDAFLKSSPKNSPKSSPKTCSHSSSPASNEKPNISTISNSTTKHDTSSSPTVNKVGDDLAEKEIDDNILENGGKIMLNDGAEYKVRRSPRLNSKADSKDNTIVETTSCELTSKETNASESELLKSEMRDEVHLPPRKSYFLRRLGGAKPELESFLLKSPRQRRNSSSSTQSAIEPLEIIPESPGPTRKRRNSASESLTPVRRSRRLSGLDASQIKGK